MRISKWVFLFLVPLSSVYAESPPVISPHEKCIVESKRQAHIRTNFSSDPYVRLMAILEANAHALIGARFGLQAGYMGAPRAIDALRVRGAIQSQVSAVSTVIRNREKLFTESARAQTISQKVIDPLRASQPALYERIMGPRERLNQSPVTIQRELASISELTASQRASLQEYFKTLKRIDTFSRQVTQGAARLGLSSSLGDVSALQYKMREARIARVAPTAPQMRTRQAVAGGAIGLAAGGAMGIIASPYLVKNKCSDDSPIDMSQARLLGDFVDVSMADACEFSYRGAQKLLDMSPTDLEKVCERVPQLHHILTALNSKAVDRMRGAPKPVLENADCRSDGTADFSFRLSNGVSYQVNMGLQKTEVRMQEPGRTYRGQDSLTWSVPRSFEARDSISLPRSHMQVDPTAGLPGPWTSDYEKFILDRIRLPMPEYGPHRERIQVGHGVLFVRPLQGVIGRVCEMIAANGSSGATESTTEQ
ncbi:MAG: hypothetical protein K2Q26_14725 [Bdellovibrionales bacterium]|nr:hypothetical protein [Bdellovibrionales bacterium]